MDEKFGDMIKIIDDISNTMESLTAVQRDIIKAVGSDDLAMLAECMKKQQALALSMRNIDQKRINLQKEMGMENIKLSELPQKAKDADMQIRVRKSAERLTAQYKIMKGASEVSRSALECNLHKVEQYMQKMGVDPSQTQTSTIAGVHTDFHA